MEDLTGKQFGPYRVVGPLGEGGMAAVYKAYQASMDRYVALKVLPQYFARDPEFVGRFAQEAKVLAKLQHLHILAVHDFGEADGYTFIVMPFVETGTLADLLGGEPLPLSHIQQIVSQVGGALGYAHLQGVVHRDVKPSNVLVDRQGNCLLTDFGIAKMVEGTMAFTQTGGIIGTPAYMSPEQILGEKLDGRSDIYSLGVLLYEMAAGRPPFRAETPPAIFVKHLHDPLPPPHIYNPDIPDGVERVILKALCKDREDRFETMDEMVTALAKGIAGQLPTVLARDPDDGPELPAARERLPGTELAQPPTKRRKEARKQKEARKPKERVERHMPRWGWWAIGGLALVALIVALVVLLGPDGTAEDDAPEIPGGTETPGAVVAEATKVVTAGGAEEKSAEGWDFEVRVSSSSDWSHVTLLLWPGGYIVRERTLEEGGEGLETEMTDRTIVLNQDIGLAEVGNWVYVNKTITLSEPPPGEMIEFEIERGCVGFVEVEVYNLATGSSILVGRSDDDGACEGASILGVTVDDLLTDSPSPLPAESPGKAIYREGVRLKEQGDWDEAMAKFDEALELGWESADLYYRRAWVCHQMTHSGRCSLEQALADYSAAIDLNPDDASYLGDRGWAYLHWREYELAIADLTRAIELNPGEASFYGARGEAYGELGDWAAALEDHGRAIELEPDNGERYVTRGWTYRRMGEFDLAEADFAAAVELAPEEPWAWGQRGLFYREEGRYQLALDSLDQAIELESGTGEYHATRAWVYQWMGEFELAIADSTTAIEREPENVWFRRDRGTIYREQGDYQAALDDLNAAIEMAPDYSELLANRSDIYREMGEFDLALADLDRAIEMNPEESWHWRQRGWLFRDMGDVEATLAGFDKAIELGHDDSHVYAERAWIYWEMGEHDVAIADWTAAIEMQPGQAWHWWDRAWAYDHVGDYDAAKADFWAFLRLSEGGPPEFDDPRADAQRWLESH